jgi:predicted MFS family arabinose efflux permease
MSQPISLDVERANTRHLYAEIFWMSIAFAMEWYFLQVFAIRLGATPAHLGTLTSVRAILLALGSGLAGRWLARFDNPIRAISGPTLIYRLVLYVGIALSASLPGAQVDALVGMVVLSALPTGLAQGCFLGMLPKAVSDRQLAKVVARRTLLMNVGVLVFVVGFGQFLEALPFAINYQIAFGIAFLASFMSWWNVRRIKVPDTPRVDPAQVSVPKVNVWKNPEFVRLMVAVVAICTGVFMAAPLVQLYLVRGLDASDAWISVFGLCEVGAGALITLRLDRLIERYGTSRLMILAAFAMFLQTLILAVITSLPPFIVGQLTFGSGWFALIVIMYKRLTETVPQADFPPFAAAYQTLINVALFIGPLIGTFVIEHDMTLPAALLLVAAVRFGAGIVTWAFCSRQAPVPAAEPIHVT